jgi:hypothetical protein
MKQRILPGTPGNLKAAVIGSSVLVLPFMILELVNRRDFPNGFPIPLFGFMWLMAVAFIVILMPIVRSRQAAHQTMPSSLSVLARVALLIVIAWLWVGLVIDQMPCFLGVPNCD